MKEYKIVEIKFRDHHHLEDGLRESEIVDIDAGENNWILTQVGYVIVKHPDYYIISGLIADDILAEPELSHTMRILRCDIVSVKTLVPSRR